MCKSNIEGSTASDFASVTHAISFPVSLFSLYVNSETSFIH